VLLIWLAVHPGFEAALHLHRSRRWVDPASGKQQQRGCRPKSQEPDDKPQEKALEPTLRKPDLGQSVGP